MHSSQLDVAGAIATDALKTQAMAGHPSLPADAAEAVHFEAHDRLKVLTPEPSDDQDTDMYVKSDVCTKHIMAAGYAAPQLDCRMHAKSMSIMQC